MTAGGQVAIQRIGAFYRVRFRRKGVLHTWFCGTAREACDYAAGVLLGSERGRV